MPLDQLPEDYFEKDLEAKEMSFVDHLEELRWHVLRSAIAIAVGMVAAFVFKDFFFGEIVLGPAKPDFWTYRKMCEMGRFYGSETLCIEKLNFELQSRTMTGQFTMHLLYSFVAGLVLAFPYVFWEIWRFISPGLYGKEKRITRGAVFFVSLLFFIGILFGYYIVAPLSVNFLSSYQLDDSIVNLFDITSYISTVTTLVLACGAMFQLPMVALVLTKAGMLTPGFMRTYRRHGTVVILIIAALITPPDVVSQVLVSLPLFLLYELSIFISAGEVKRMAKAAKLAETKPE